MLELEKINAVTTYSVRHAVLRKGKTIETCVFAGDDEATTTHFGAYHKQNLVGVISVYKTNHKYFIEKNQFQIRGMAVLEDFQGKKFGAQLLTTAAQFCWQEGADLIWFNARESAVAFYEKSGYQIVGTSFDLPNSGQHFLMFKKNNF